MFDDVDSNVHLGLWAAAGVAVMLLAGVLGGLWVREWQQARAAHAAGTPLLDAIASSTRSVSVKTASR